MEDVEVMRTTLSPWKSVERSVKVKLHKYYITRYTFVLAGITLIMSTYLDDVYGSSCTSSYVCQTVRARYAHKYNGRVYSW